MKTTYLKDKSILSKPKQTSSWLIDIIVSVSLQLPHLWEHRRRQQAHRRSPQSGGSSDPGPHVQVYPGGRAAEDPRGERSDRHGSPPAALHRGAGGWPPEEGGGAEEGRRPLRQRHGRRGPEDRPAAEEPGAEGADGWEREQAAGPDGPLQRGDKGEDGAEHGGVQEEHDPSGPELRDPADPENPGDPAEPGAAGRGAEGQAGHRRPEHEEAADRSVEVLRQTDPVKRTLSGWRLWDR